MVKTLKMECPTKVSLVEGILERKIGQSISIKNVQRCLKMADPQL
jgi:hypothetical protein